MSAGYCLLVSNKRSERAAIKFLRFKNHINLLDQFTPTKSEKNLPFEPGQYKMSEKEPNIESDVLESLMDTWARFPQMRLGQLIMNVVRPEKPCPEIFYIEDSQLIKKLRDF